MTAKPKERPRRGWRKRLWDSDCDLFAANDRTPPLLGPDEVIGPVFEGETPDVPLAQPARDDNDSMTPRPQIVRKPAATAGRSQPRARKTA